MVYKPNLNTRHLTIDVFYQAGDPAFVCAANGPIITDTVQELEDLLANEYQRDLFIHGDGIYTLEAEYESGQYGPEGRCELPPGYGLHVMAYRGITEDAPQGAVLSLEELEQAYTWAERGAGMLEGLWRGDFDIATVQADIIPVVQFLAAKIKQAKGE